MCCVCVCVYGPCVRQCWLPCAAFAMYDTARYSQQHRKNREETTESLAIDLETGKVFLQSWKFACEFLKRRGLVCRWIAWLSCLATQTIGFFDFHLLCVWCCDWVKYIELRQVTELAARALSQLHQNRKVEMKKQRNWLLLNEYCNFYFHSHASHSAA